MKLREGKRSGGCAKQCLDIGNRPSTLMAAVTALVLLSGCTKHEPKGQVLAVVNGQEITAEDVTSEARSEPGAQSALPAQLLQKVIARVLLAQAAHSNKLDAYPGYPSDINRMDQQFLAEKMLATVVKVSPQGSPAEVTAIIAAHPYQFAQRMRVSAKEVQFQGSNILTAVQNLDSMDVLVSRLKDFGVTANPTTPVVDTAQMPDAVAQHLEDEPIGQLFFLNDGDKAVGIVVLDRQPIQVSPDEQAVEANKMRQQISAAQQVQSVVEQLRRKSTITYQSGYAPSAPAAAKPAPEPAQ